MISSPVIGLIIEIKIQSQQEWQYALGKTKAYGICGLILDNADIDSSGHTIKIISLALPDCGVPKLFRVRPSFMVFELFI